MGQDPDAIRQDLAQTRAEMGETVDGAGDTASGTASRVRDATPSGGQVKQQARRAAGLAQENPLGLAIGAAAVGFLTGLAVPTTRVEDERLGPVADQVKDTVKETGQEALQRGKQVAQEAASNAAESAKQSGQEVGDQTRQQTTGP